jgi:short-subunit dehydrogenase
MQQGILIVGASSGLGRRLAEIYAAGGAKVGVIARRENLLIELQQKFPEQISFTAGDMSADGFDIIMRSLIDKIGGVELVILAASVVTPDPLLDKTIALKTVRVNADGFALAAITACKYFEEKGAGHLAGITSIAAVRGNKPAPAYNASKAFQSNLLEGLRIRYRSSHQDIFVTELMPGYVETAMAQSERIFWMSSVEKAARQCKSAIDKKKKRAFITKRWWLIYLVLKFMPIFIYDAIVNGSWKLKRKPK